MQSEIRTKQKWNQYFWALYILLTDPALHSCTWSGFYDIGRIDTNVQTQDQRYADRLHLELQNDQI